MNRLLILLFVLGLTACASSQQEAVNNKKVATATTDKVLAQKTALPAQTVAQSSESYPYNIDLKDAEGKVMNSAKVLEQNDKPTILMFWLTTCVPCRYEMAAIQKKYDGWKSEADFNLYAISTDFEKNYPAFSKMVAENDWQWESYNDVDRKFRSIMPGELNGLPQTFLIDKDGNIAYHKRKWKPGDEDVLFEKVKSLQ